MTLSEAIKKTVNSFSGGDFTLSMVIYLKMNYGKSCKSE